MAVMIGIDPHKRSHTAVALDGTDEVLGQLRVTADPGQVDRLIAFAAAWPDRVWAVENANGLGRLLSRGLLEAGETVVDVPARLSARVRALSGAGHKTDSHDARSTAIAGRHGAGVAPVTVDDPLLVLFDIVLERRWQLVSSRQKTLCRIHDQLAYLLPGGAAKGLTADKTAAALRRIRPTDPVGIRRRLIVRELLAELRAIDRKIAPLDADIAWMLDEHGTTLTNIVGIGRTGAATILAITGDPGRFRSAAAYASFAGTAPIAASSGDTIRYRLNRGGNRQLNKVIHTAAKTQIRLPGPGRDYYQRRRADGKTNAEAIRALKRHITTAIYRTVQTTPPLVPRGERWRRRRTSEAETPSRADRQPPRVTSHSSDLDNLPHPPIPGRHGTGPAASARRRTHPPRSPLAQRGFGSPTVGNPRLRSPDRC